MRHLFLIQTRKLLHRHRRIATCIPSHSLLDLSKEAQKFIELSKHSTGNTTCDVVIDGHHYDFKTQSQNLGVSKNHIIFINFEDLNQANRNLYLLYQRFQKDIKDESNLHKREYMKDAEKELSSIINNSSMSLLDKVHIWNSYVYKSLNIRPNTVNFPLLIPITNKPFEPDVTLANQVKDVKLPISKSLESKAVFDSVLDAIAKNSTSTRHKAFIDTLGRIGEDHSQDPD